MYPHSRSLASHSNNPPISHYTHHTPPSYHPGRNTSSSHLHVLQNPPQSTVGGNSNFILQGPSASPSRNQQYQPYYPSPASIGIAQDVWNNGGMMNGNEAGGGQNSNNNMRPRPSGGNPVPVNRMPPRPADQASTPKSNSSSSDPRPNWGLIGRQLSQIAGDVSTSVRQNELVITLLERLIERVDGGAMQGNPAMRGQVGIQEEGEPARGPGRVMPRRPQPSGYEAMGQESGRSREEANLRHSSTMMSDSHAQAESGNASHASTSHYLDNDLGSSSFDFGGSSQNMSHRTQYPSAVNHRFDADIPPKRTPPTVSFMLSGDVAPNQPSSSHVQTYHNSRQQQQQHSSSQHAHHSNEPMTSDNVTLDESYNRIPSPVFDDSTPADHEPPVVLGLSQYYSQEGGRSSPPPHPLHQHGMHVHQHPPAPPPPPPPPIERQDSRSRLNVLQSAGMGSLEDAGLIPISSTSSTSVTPALGSRPRQTLEADGVGDQSIDTSMAYLAADEDPSRVESANADWKLWQTPKSSAKRIPAPSKYRSIKQVKNERKEKTKRSISTIGRIPLKEYLEVGSDYKAVRRMARTVYNTWLSINVRLAKQDPDRLRACYHKLEYEFPILGDCEDHWKAKELMLQVIDNAIDEIAFHRRKEERKAQEPEGAAAVAAADANNTNNETNASLRRDAAAADLYTNEEERPNTRRRKGGNVARDKSNDEVEVVYATAQRSAAAPPHSNEHSVDSSYTQHQQHWDSSGEGANLFAQPTPHEHQPPPAAPRTARRTQQQMTAGWH